jgi:1,4-alpha-glucan branching enzyme
MVVNVSKEELQSLLEGRHGAPARILGIHEVDANNVVIRALRSNARTITVVLDASGERFAMTRAAPEGLFEVTVPGTTDTKYHFEVVTQDDTTFTYIDPYIFPTQITSYDIYLFGEGRLLYAYEKFGAHPMTIDGVQGVNFAVWAPNAERVSVVGDFNAWDERVHPMTAHPTGGIWELFIPGLQQGDVYRYAILSRTGGYRVLKADPYAYWSEVRPANASVVFDIEGYEWGDDAWMTARGETRWLEKPIAVYEMHAGSWKRGADGEWLDYRQLAHELVPYLTDMGYTHIELMPIAEHPFDGSWGYQVTGYFAVSSRFGTPKDFMYFVDHLHQHGIGVIVDWVPAHFPKDGHALSYFDGTHLYEHSDPRQGEHPDWGTYIFNYGRNEVRNFLISNLLFWLKKYHIDGVRVDAVSSMLYLDFSRREGQWVPNRYGGRENLEAIAFIKEFNEVAATEAPGVITIAEESTAWPMVSRPTYVGGLGFTFKWNMGWMHDTLYYFSKDPIFRRYEHNQITFSMLYAFNENFMLSYSHDEVVHGKGSMIGKMAGDWWQKFANLRLLYGHMYMHPGKKLLFMGQEFGQWREWSEARALDWELIEWPTHARMANWTRDLNKFYKENAALWELDFDPAGFQWCDANDADNSIYTYMRFASDSSDFVVVALNATPVVRYNYRIGVPQAGFYREVLNSDSEYYGGSNVGNKGGVQAEERQHYQWQHSIAVTLPPLACVVFKLGDPPEPKA